MTSKLTLYNGALRNLRERPLATLAENREPRRLLDQAWDTGAVMYCLEAGQWRFAKRSQQIDYDPSIEPDWGYLRVFEKPEDFVRLTGLWCDAAMREPHEDYREESGFWYSSIDTIYVSFVSSSNDYGMDLALWPMSFVKYVEAHLALEVAGPLTEKGQEMFKLRKVYLTEALSKDSMADPTRKLPVGSWVRARSQGRISTTGQPQ